MRRRRGPTRFGPNERPRRGSSRRIRAHSSKGSCSKSKIGCWSSVCCPLHAASTFVSAASAKVPGSASVPPSGAIPRRWIYARPRPPRSSAISSVKPPVRFPGTPLDSLFVTRDGPYVEVYARRRDFPQEDFFGLGPDSDEGSRSNYAVRDSFARVTGGFRRHKVRAGVSLGYLDPSIGRGTDSRMPSTAEIFAPSDVPGLAVQPAFSVIEPFIEVETSDHRAQRAGRRLVSLRLHEVWGS